MKQLLRIHYLESQHKIEPCEMLMFNEESEVLHILHFGLISVRTVTHLRNETSENAF